MNKLTKNEVFIFFGVLAAMIVIVSILWFGFVKSFVNITSTDKETEQQTMNVLYPKQEMIVNEISQNTIVITTLDFEDAFNEIEQIHNELNGVEDE